MDDATSLKQTCGADCLRPINITEEAIMDSESEVSDVTFQGKCDRDNSSFGKSFKFNN